MFAHTPSARFRLFLLCAVTAAAQTLNPSKIDALATDALKAWNAPGCAIAIIQGDRVVYQKGYGVKELGKPNPVTTKTVFAIGSTTKAFTTAILAMLADDGSVKTFTVDVRVDTPQEVEYYRNGGILPYVLRQLAGA